MNKNLALLCAAAILLGSVFMYSHRSPDQVVSPVPQQSNLGELNRFTTPAINTSIGCGTTSTLLLATSTGRLYAAFVNDSANTVYISQGTAAVGSNGIRLNASGGAFEINQDNLYTGSIYCIASSTSVVTVSYK